MADEKPGSVRFDMTPRSVRRAMTPPSGGAVPASGRSKWTRILGEKEGPAEGEGMSDHQGPDALAFEVTMNGKVIVQQNITGLPSAPGEASAAAALAAEKLLLDWHSRLTAAIAEALRHG